MSISDLLVPNNYNLFANTITTTTTVVNATATYSGGGGPGTNINAILTFQKLNGVITLQIQNTGSVVGAPATAGYFSFPGGTVPAQFVPIVTGGYFVLFGWVINGPGGPGPGTSFQAGMFIMLANGSINIYPLNPTTLQFTNFSNTPGYLIGFDRSVLTYFL